MSLCAADCHLSLGKQIFVYNRGNVVTSLYFHDPEQREQAWESNVLPPHSADTGIPVSTMYDHASELGIRADI